MLQLLLVSSSRVHGSPFLQHCAEAIRDHFSPGCEVLFVPYALADHDRYRDLVSEAFESMQLQLTSIHDTKDPQSAIDDAKGIFVGGGNSFRLLKTCYDLGLMQPIRDAVQQRGVPYMGSSAGTNLACPTIRTTNDMPIVEPPSLAALGLVEFQINPHFIDADPDSTHQGETREQRLKEFHEENHVPVAGIREGSWLRVAEGSITLGGTTGMKLFRKDSDPLEVSGGDVTKLLTSG